MDKQTEFVLRTIEERGVKFIRLWFTDVAGTLKSVAIAPAEVEGAFAEGLGFDGSAIEGLARTYEADMLAMCRMVFIGHINLPGRGILTQRGQIRAPGLCCKSGRQGCRNQRQLPSRFNDCLHGSNPQWFVC